MHAHPVLVVGMHGTSAAVHALKVALSIALAAGGELVAVHVNARSPAAALASTTGLAALAVAGAATADQAHLDCEIELAGHPITWTFETRSGDAADELERAADERGAACIVVGQQGHRLVHRMVFTSVTDRLVQHAHRPVLVVPRDVDS
jgi:nucleotide-binding universal stress UspA family protein